MIRTVFFTTIVSALTLGPRIALAQSGARDLFEQGLNTSADISGLHDAGTNPPNLQAQIGVAINGLLAVVGVIFLTVVLIGGYQWMTAGGNEDKIGKAKGLIIGGINGMLVVFLAFALVRVILNALGSATNLN